MENCNFLCCSK